jgi:hypothetical protein
MQVLLKPEMVQRFTIFSDVMKLLERFAVRRQLFKHEKYDAARLMGLLTLYCYESATVDEAATDVAATHISTTDHTSGLCARARSTHSDARWPGSVRLPGLRYHDRRTFVACVRTCHRVRLVCSTCTSQQLIFTRCMLGGAIGGSCVVVRMVLGRFLLLIGKATATLGSKELHVTHLDTNGAQGPRALREGDRIQLVGGMYAVKSVSASSVLLDRPLELSKPAGVAPEYVPPMPPALDNSAKSGEVWLMLEVKSNGKMNVDCQLLLFSMGAHKSAIQLLGLPFTPDRLLSQDLETRAVLRACCACCATL